MRTAAVAGAAALVVLLAGCSSSSAPDHAGTAPGCGMVEQRRVVGLVGSDADTTAKGSVRGLRADHRALSCRSVDPQDATRSVLLTATYHPAPYSLPRHSCDQGWVYAGSVTKYAPACQEGVDAGGRTRLVVRWQPYLVRVSVNRPDHDWAGDPEIALAMSRDLAQRLGVKEAAGDG